VASKGIDDIEWGLDRNQGVGSGVKGVLMISRWVPDWNLEVASGVQGVLIKPEGYQKGFKGQLVTFKGYR
jgi:hypothetical protein